jgi:hypothetical protein
MPENMLDKSADEYIDPKGYWIDPERKVRRMSDNGQQAVIIQATGDCSVAEWERFYQAIVACLDATKP